MALFFTGGTMITCAVAASPLWLHY
jgi:pilus assembly protein Flp/PilA